LGPTRAIFTLIDAILLRWLPVQNPQELALLARNPSRPMTSFSYPDYRYIRDQNRSYTGLIAFSGGDNPISLSSPGQHGSSQLVALSMVSGNYFEVLGVQPAIGRLFNPADNEKEGAHPYAVLSHPFWKRAFGEDSSVVGRDVLLNGARFQVVGVSREGFRGATVGNSPDVFVPIIMFRTFNPHLVRWNTRDNWWLTLMGRLKPGVTRGQAEAELQVLWQQILNSDPERRPVATWDKEYRLNNTAVVLPGSQGYSYLRNQTAKPLMVLMVTVVLVLLIACANVANLLLARAVARRREIALRLALGAGRRRLVMQLLTESITLSLLGGAASLIVAWMGVGVLVTFLPQGTFPVELNLSPDARLLSFACGLSVVSGLIFGLVPALKASRTDLVSTLKSDASTVPGRSGRWDLRRSLVSLQVALSLLLLAGAGLFVQTLSNLRGLDLGMDRQNLLLVDTNVGQLGYQPQRERAFHDRLREEVQRLPGVKAASAAWITPLSGSHIGSIVQFEGYQWKPDERPIVSTNAATPRYFEAAGIPIVLGRDFQESDNLTVLPDRHDPPASPPGTQAAEPPGPPRVVIVNEALARRFFRGESAIGRRLCLDDTWSAKQAWEIVGVVRDTRYFDVRGTVEPMIYSPLYREASGGGGTLCVRAIGAPRSLVNTIRRLVMEIDSAVSVTEAKTMEDNLNRNLVQERFVATMGGFFGLVALLLAAIGLYGVTSEAVARRTREIGIRMALGAKGSRVLGMVLRDAMAMVLIGAIIGIPTILGLTRYVESLLFGVKAQDPATLVSAALLLLAVTVLAAFLPALRATRVQPMQALRRE
jgi:predicted permease